MSNLAYSILSVVISFFIIKEGYKYYKFKWPENYFGPSDKANIFISTKPYYYLFFRLFPVFITIFLIQGTIIKAGVNLIKPTFLGLLTGFFYSLSADGKAIFDLLIKSPNIKTFFNKTHQYLIHIITLITLSFVGLLAGYLSKVKKLYFLLPQIDGLIDNIWAFFITILISYWLYKVMKKPKEISVNDVIENSIDNISKKLIIVIEKESQKNNADQILIKAICIAENMERPRWIRKFEYILGSIKKKGSYGIMQIQYKRPLSDEKSIKIGVKKYFSNTKNLNFPARMEKIRKFNDNDEYVSLVEEVYRFITPCS